MKDKQQRRGWRLRIDKILPVSFKSTLLKISPSIGLKVGSLFTYKVMASAVAAVLVGGIAAESAGALDVIDRDTVIQIQSGQLAEGNIFDEILERLGTLEIAVAAIPTAIDFPPGPPPGIEKTINDIEGDVDAIFCAVHPDTGRCRGLPESITN